jgi:hypothetical protein
LQGISGFVASNILDALHITRETHTLLLNTEAPSGASVRFGGCFVGSPASMTPHPLPPIPGPDPVPQPDPAPPTPGPDPQPLPPDPNPLPI